MNVTDEDGSGLNHEIDRWGVPPRNASLSRIKEMMIHHKHITQYKLYTRCQTSDWWIDLSTFMPHLMWLSLWVGREDEYFGESAIVLKGLPSLTYLCIGGVGRYGSIYGECSVSSISLHLPALSALELDPHSNFNRAMRLCELDIECPSLVNMQCTIQAESAMMTSWFAHLRILDLTLLDVRKSGYIWKISYAHQFGKT